MSIAIQAQGLSKKYLINHQRTHNHDSLREKLMEVLRGNRAKNYAIEQEEFWGLKDLTFEIRQGDKVGIIGRNGAGKSTLLKILSRITDPSEGRISIHGRVASLLEVGAGFHPELTGRENVYLNGAVMGMRRQEIQRKFDEIVAFAEMEKFLDTPVKRYSSGMYLRLAFSVAAHLEPEILIVDEVLAVGDAGFQKKCITKMNEVGARGATVLFVSHNIPAIQNLCGTAILLSNGRLTMQGDAAAVIHCYLEHAQQIIETPLSDRVDRKGDGAIRFTSLDVKEKNGYMVSAHLSGQDMSFFLKFNNNTGGELKNVLFSIGIDNEAGERVAYLSNEISEGIFGFLPASVTSVEVKIMKLPLVPGTYHCTLFCSINGEIADWIENAASFIVEAGDFFGTGRMPPVAGQGYFFMPHWFRW